MQYVVYFCPDFHSAEWKFYLYDWEYQYFIFILFVTHVLLFLMGKELGPEWQSTQISVYLILNMSEQFSNKLLYFTFPPAVFQVQIIRMLNFKHCTSCLGYSKISCGLNFHIDWYWTFIFHSYKFFGEYSILLPFFSWFLLLNFETF